MNLKELTTIALPLFLVACGGSSSSTDDTTPLPEDDALPLGYQVLNIDTLEGAENCELAMIGAESALETTPEEIDPVDAAEVDPVTGVSTQTWYYWSNGIGFEFQWGGTLGGCQTTMFEFSPITI